MSTLPQNLHDALRDRFGELTGVRAVGGGDTSAAVRATSASAGELFIKYSDGAAGQTYRAEADGLAALRNATAETPALYVPEPLAVRGCTAQATGYLVLPWLEAGAGTRASGRGFGESLAALHVESADGHVDGDARYGWPDDNFLGPEPQSNRPTDDWVAFFRERRLLAMADRMRAKGLWRGRWDVMLEALSRKLDDLLPARPPAALLHGDLWGGNAMALADGRTALIDPAVYRGHDEVDVAMTKLFGGFSDDFYEGYRAVRGREAGFAERLAIYQLYYLIMHLGVSAGYAGQVEAGLRRWA